MALGGCNQMLYIVDKYSMVFRQSIIEEKIKKASFLSTTLLILFLYIIMVTLHLQVVKVKQEPVGFVNYI